jgi:hypothetical protein
MEKIQAEISELLNAGKPSTAPSAAAQILPPAVNFAANQKGDHSLPGWIGSPPESGSADLSYHTFLGQQGC